MPTFISRDGSDLEVAEPVVVLPGGPLQDPRYLGNLGGLDARRALAVLELRPRRIDQLVDDVEVLRGQLGAETMDVLGHSAGAGLALLYAAAHPDRIRKLALITPERAHRHDGRADAAGAGRDLRAARAPAVVRRSPGGGRRLGRRHRDPRAAPARQGARLRALGRRVPRARLGR